MPDRQLQTQALAQPQHDQGSQSRWRVRLRVLLKPPLLLISLLLFVLAIELMQAGAAALEPLLVGRLQVTGFADGLGLGWLLSYAVLSGSPAASSGLALLDAGVIDRLAAYGVMVGSRFGASGIVLFLGLIYVLRGHDRTRSLDIGLLAMVVAASQQLLALPLGLAMMAAWPWTRWKLVLPADRLAPLEAGLAPLMGQVEAFVPRIGIFVLGIGLVVLSFKLFDLALPSPHPGRKRRHRLAKLTENPWFMLVLGAGITLVTMSISVSLGILVPLHLHRGVRHQRLVPYILGANVSTYADTALAALLIGHPEAMPVVVIEVLSLLAVSIALLALAERPYQKRMLHMATVAAQSRKGARGLFAAMILLPLMLMWL